MSAAFITSESGSRHWTTGAFLVELARRDLKQGSRFTTLELEAWMPEAVESGLVRKAIEVCKRNGYLTSKMSLCKDTARTLSTYTVTALGAEAIRAAAAGKLPKGGARGPLSVARPPSTGTFVARLWALMRARRTLDALTAAETLVDAGGNVTTAARTASGHLSRWAAAGALAEGRKREANGCKRYVLVQDSPHPPAPPRKGRGAGSTHTETQAQ